MTEILAASGVLWIALAVALFFAPLAIWWHVATLRKKLNLAITAHEKSSAATLQKLDAVVAELKRITGAT